MITPPKSNGKISQQGILTVLGESLIRLFLFSQIFFVCHSSALAQQQIPAGPTAITQVTFRAERIAYEMRVLDDYDQYTADPKQIQAEARKVVELDRNCELGLTPLEQVSQNYGAGKAVIVKGSKDPLVYLATGVGAFYAKAPKKEMLNYFQLAKQAVDSSKYPSRERAIIQILARVYDMTANRDSDRDVKAERLSVAKTLAKWIAEEGDVEDDQRCLWYAVQRYLAYRTPGTTDEVVSLDPRDLIALLEEDDLADPWFAHMLRADMFMLLARQASGSNDKDAQHKFKQAGEEFEKAWELHPKFPEPSVQLITLSRDGYAERTPRFWFDQAVAGQLDYPPAYAHYRSALRPEYGGSITEMYKFGLECAKTKRYDTPVPFELLECLHMVEAIVGDDTQIWREEGICDAVFDICEGAARAKEFQGEPVPKERKQWMRATQIAIGARSQRLGDVADLWDQTSEKDILRAFQMYHVSIAPANLRNLSTAAKALGLKIYVIEAAIEKVQDLETARAAQEALKSATQKLKQNDLIWINYWRDALDHLVKFYEGDWVEITFPANLPEVADAKQWRVIDERTVEGTGSQPLRFEWLARLGAPFEVKIDIETKEMPATETMLAGVMLGNYAPEYNRPLGRQFGVNTKTGLAGTVKDGHPELFSGVTKQVNHVQIQAWRGYFAFFVNDVRLLTRHEAIFSPFGWFAFWTPGNEDTRVITKFSNLKIRKLNYDMPPEEGDHEARVAYFSERIEKGGDNSRVRIDRGLEYLALEQWDKAAEDFQVVVKREPNNLFVQLKLGDTLAETGHYKEALEAYEAILKAEPKAHKALDRIAWLQATAEDPEYRKPGKALSTIYKAMKMTDHSEIYLTTRAAAYLGLKDYKEAARDLKMRMMTPARGQERVLEKLKKAIENEEPYKK